LDILVVERSASLIVDAVVEGLLPHLLNDLSLLARTLERLRPSSIVIFTKQLFRYLSTKYLNYTISRDTPRWWDADRARVGAVAGILYDLYKENKPTAVFVSIVKSGSGLHTLSIQRACILSMSKFHGEYLVEIVNYLLALWADKLFVTHRSVVEQEGTNPSNS